MAHTFFSRELPMLLHRPWLHLTAALLCVLGCEPTKHQTITRIGPDGRLTREVILPRDASLPPEALKRAKTYPPSTQPADYLLADAWKQRWATCEDAPTPSGAEEGAYFKATGTFADADRVPESYHLIAYPFMDRVSVDHIEHEYVDFELFGIDTWNETITETVSLAEYEATLDEIALKLAPVIERTLDALLGERYELDDFHAFLRAKTIPVLKDLALWQFQYACAGDFDDFETFPPAVRELKAILARLGFDLPLTADGQAIDEEAGPAFERFVVELVARKVRWRPTGQPLTEPQARAFLKALGYEIKNDAPPADEATTKQAAPTSADQEDQKDQEDIDALRAEIFRGVFKEMYGCDYEEVALVWGAKLGGASRGGPAGLIENGVPGWSGRSFQYVLTAAGPILETNGQRTGGDSVEWNFGLSDLWPKGRRMCVRAVRWNREAERAVFGRSVFARINDVLKAKNLIAGSQPLRDALRAAIEQAGPAPLEALADDGKGEGSSEARALLELVRKREEAR